MTQQMGSAPRGVCKGASSSGRCGWDRPDAPGHTAVLGPHSSQEPGTHRTAAESDPLLWKLERRPLTPAAATLHEGMRPALGQPPTRPLLCWSPGSPAIPLTSSAQTPPPGPLQTVTLSPACPSVLWGSLVLPHKPSSDGVPVIYHIKRGPCCLSDRAIGQSGGRDEPSSHFLSPPQPAS